MKKEYNTRRRGISLVEMTIDIILFGVLSTITLIYYKNLFNIDLTAKKARISALMDQGRQLSGAYDIFVAEYGVSPTQINLNDFNQSNVMILNDLPVIIKEMSTKGWELNVSTGIPNTSDKAFQFSIDLNGSNYLNLSDDDLYCAIYNHEINKSIDLNVSNNTNFGDVFTLHNLLGKNFCYSELVGLNYQQHIIIIK